MDPYPPLHISRSIIRSPTNYGASCHIRICRIAGYHAMMSLRAALHGDVHLVVIIGKQLIVSLSRDAIQVDLKV